MRLLKVALTLCVVTPGCVAFGQASVPTPVPVTGGQLSGQQLPGATPATTVQAVPSSSTAPVRVPEATAIVSDRYRLQPGDTITVRYRTTPEFNQGTTLQPDGTVTLRLVGPVLLRGLTAAEAKTKIQELAAKRLVDPEVSIDLNNVDGPHYTVLGEVGKPGRYTLHGHLTVEDALAMAGGLTTGARHTKIVLVHRISETIGSTQLIDVKQFETKPKFGTELVAMHADDIIVVPKSKLANVERYVKIGNFGVGASFPFYPGAN